MSLSALSPTMFKVSPKMFKSFCGSPKQGRWHGSQALKPAGWTGTLSDPKDPPTRPLQPSPSPVLTASGSVEGGQPDRGSVSTDFHVVRLGSCLSDHT